MIEPQRQDKIFAKMIVGIVGVMMVFGLFFLLGFLTTKKYSLLLISLGFLSFSISFFGAGIRIIEPQERGVVEFLGRFYRVLRPGPRWIIPFFQKIRAYVPVWQQPIPLFEEKTPIDFKLGGTAVLINPLAWIWPKGKREGNEEEVDKSVVKMVYNVAQGDYRKAAREHIEATFRPTLNNCTVEEALEIVYQRKLDWAEIIKENFKWLKETLSDFGIELAKITVTDYQWSDEVVEIRRRVFQSQRSIEVAGYEAKAARQIAEQKARESGQIHGEIVRILTQKRYNFSREEASRIATQLVTYFRGTETKRLTDIRIGGLEEILSLLGDLLKSLKK